MANIVAGHLLLRLIGGGFEGLFSFLPLFLSQAALVALELAVAVIQGYVFIVLITLYAKEVSVYIIPSSFIPLSRDKPLAPDWILRRGPNYLRDRNLRLSQ